MIAVGPALGLGGASFLGPFHAWEPLLQLETTLAFLSVRPYVFRITPCTMQHVQNLGPVTVLVKSSDERSKSKGNEKSSQSFAATHTKLTMDVPATIASSSQDANELRMPTFDP